MTQQRLSKKQRKEVKKRRNERNRKRTYLDSEAK